MKHHSLASYVNNYFDHYIKWAILKQTQNQNLVGNSMEMDVKLKNLQ